MAQRARAQHDESRLESAGHIAEIANLRGRLCSLESFASSQDILGAKHKTEQQLLENRVTSLASELAKKDAEIDSLQEKLSMMSANEAVLQQNLGVLESGEDDSKPLKAALKDCQEKLFVCRGVERQHARMGIKIRHNLDEFQRKLLLAGEDLARVNATNEELKLSLDSANTKLEAAERLKTAADDTAAELRQNLNRASIRCIDLESELAATKSERGALLEQLSAQQSSLAEKIEEEVNATIRDFHQSVAQPPAVTSALHIDSLLAALPQQKLSLGLETLAEALLHTEKQRLGHLAEASHLRIERDAFRSAAKSLRKRVAALTHENMGMQRECSAVARRGSAEKELHRREVADLENRHLIEMKRLKQLVPKVMDVLRSRVAASICPLKPTLPRLDLSIDVEAADKRRSELADFPDELRSSAALKELFTRLERERERSTILRAELQRMRRQPVEMAGGVSVDVGEITAEMLHPPEELQHLAEENKRLKNRFESMRLRVEEAEERVQAVAAVKVAGEGKEDDNAGMKKALSEAKRELVKVTCEYEMKLNAQGGSKRAVNVAELQRRCRSQV